MVILLRARETIASEYSQTCKPLFMSYLDLFIIRRIAYKCKKLDCLCSLVLTRKEQSFQITKASLVHVHDKSKNNNNESNISIYISYAVYKIIIKK